MERQKGRDTAGRSATVWDHGRWSLTRAVRVDFMTRYIMEKMLAALPFEGLRTLELGCGTGRLSRLALDHGAHHVTLLDSSRRALELCRSHFHDAPADRFTIIDDDLIRWDAPAARFDLVFSSGLIEHFRGGERRAIIRRHLELSTRHVLIVHPADSLWAYFFSNNPVTRRLYGYQESFSTLELDSYLDESVASVRHEPFYPFYTMPFLHGREFNRRLDAAGWNRRLGQLVLTRIVKKDIDEK